MLASSEDDIFAQVKRRPRFPVYGIIGIMIILFAEVALFSGVYIVGIYFTPIVWTGYILVIDGMLYLQDRSFIRTRPKQFLLMLAWSIVCWLVFEGYNLRLENWTYTGLPEYTLTQAIGYCWSFATIFPAVLLTAKFVEGKLPPKHFRFRVSPSRPFLFTTMVVGFAMLLMPLLVSKELASTMFGLVWMGVVFLLDPIHYLKGRNSVIGQLSQGNGQQLISLLLAGFLCGILWEFWNYWAAAKWTYSIPISFAGPKIFEMPLLGYLGFLPFAVECFVLSEFLYVLFPHLARHG